MSVPKKKLTPIQQKLAAPEAPKPRNYDVEADSAFRDTVLSRLNEVGELIAATPALRFRTGKIALVVKRLAELTSYVEQYR